MGEPLKNAYPDPAPDPAPDPVPDPAPQPAQDPEPHTAREAELEQQLEKLKSDFEALRAENQRLFVMNRSGEPVQDQSKDPNYNAEQFITHGFNPEYLFKE